MSIQEELEKQRVEKQFGDLKEKLEYAYEQLELIPDEEGYVEDIIKLQEWISKNELEEAKLGLEKWLEKEIEVEPFKIVEYSWEEETWKDNVERKVVRDLRGRFVTWKLK